jgi:hypothetical protein
MMMQMLEAGGLQVVIDEHGPRGRLEEPGHPGGRFETNDVHLLRENPEHARQWVGKAIKLLTNSIPRVPKDMAAKVIWMDRDAEANKESWRRLHPGQPDREMLTGRQAVLDFVKRRKLFDLLIVDFDDLVDNPVAECARVAAFVGGLDAQKMAKIPSKAHRHVLKGGRHA